MQGMEVPQAIEKILVFKSEQVQMLSADPDAVGSKERVDLDDDEIEEEKPKLLKRKLKKLSRMIVAKLQQKVNLKAPSNIVLIPQHWSFRREYSQDKRGREKLAWKFQILSNELVL
ncbi:hypothetical protein TNIN_473471 [Trichonephila inaurata madagascariensis]|uniref:DUF382 domain-containing protein n=1 Tax=Trichonephila inaurata madagascariensis TaxID=2747483 RepID=A0A8X7C3F2_9ARAC|nr:hypothetical protein TNIN_473471 [Trichonephila inaurata madagascariensis]